MSTVLFVKESHLYVETWPEARAVNVVVDSCRNFPTYKVTSLCQATFRPLRIEHQEILPMAERYAWKDQDYVARHAGNDDAKTYKDLDLTGFEKDS